jgi:phosphonate transport system substrate-binding protein
MKKLILSGILAAACFAIQTPVYAAEAEGASKSDSLVMGIFPRRNPRDTVKFFKPIADYLSLKLKRDVQLVTAKDFKSFWQGIQDKRYDLVHYNQYHYLLSKEKFGYQVILMNEEFGSTTLAGSLVVRKDSGIKSLADLKGKKVVFGGGPKAMMSYIAPTYLLREAGLKAGEYTEEFARNPPNALFSVYYKQGDVAGVGSVVIKLGIVQKQIDTTQLLTLAEGEPLAHLPWAVKKDMALDLRERIQSLLSNLSTTPAGQLLLKGAKLTNLVIASDEDYAPHQKIVDSVYGQNN